MCCCIDFKNALGSICVHHNLIYSALKHYHLSSNFQGVLRNMYSSLAAVVQTQSWTMKKFPHCISVFQGDPLSVVITMITSLFADSLLKLQLKSAYHFKCIGDLLQPLLFVDDAVLIANSVKSLQRPLCRSN